MHVLPLILFLAQAPPPDRPTARALLSESAAAIKKYKSYQIESMITVDMHGGPMDTHLELPSSISVRRPDHVRIESKSRAGDIMIASDGEHTWFYLSNLKQYVKRRAAAVPESAIGGSGLLPKNLPDIAQSIKSVEITGEDSIDLGGRKIPCWIVETTYNRIFLPEENFAIQDAVQTNWISKDRKLSLQSMFSGTVNLPGMTVGVNMAQSTRTTAIRLDPELPDSLFVFTPPADAKQTADWSLPGIARPDVIGKPAPELKAKTLNGQDVDLAALRGKVVLLNFSTTWCKPCREEVPLLAKLSAEFRAKGLRMVGVNVGEERAAVEKFLAATRISYPMVPMSEGADLIESLAINAYPTTVLIDQRGNIAAYEAGVLQEKTLREELARLGIGH